MSIKPVRAAGITDTTGALLGQSRVRRRPRNTVKNDVFEHFLNSLRKIHMNRSTRGRHGVGRRYTGGPTKGSAAGGASVYNLRLPTEGLRQGHGPVGYTLAAPAADPFVGPLVYPRSTPGRPPPDPRPNPVDRFICYLPVFLRMMWKTSFFTVFRGLRRTRLSSNRAPVVSVMRAAWTGLIDTSWVLDTRQQQRRNMCSKMI